MYGNMIWGIFPIRAAISWEGHFMGLVAGVILAFVYRKEAIQAPKYQYEIEKEMGIEPPDFEAEWREKIAALERAEEERKRQEQGYVITYQYTPTNKQESIVITSISNANSSTTISQNPKKE